MAKLVGRVGVGSGSGRVNRVVGQVGLTRIFHMSLFIYFNKENNMYLLFGKLYNKLLNVKCIILNSLLISRMNSVKLINIYCGRNESFFNQVLSYLEMALNLSPQGFAQSHIGERRLPLIPYKSLA